MTNNFKQYEGLVFRFYDKKSNTSTRGMLFVDHNGTKPHVKDYAFHLKFLHSFSQVFYLWDKGYYYTINRGLVLNKNIFYDKISTHRPIIKFDWDYYTHLFGNYRDLYLELFYGVTSEI
jgi:hypothetical protein